MNFRIGVNLGDVIEEEDRIYGDGVNIAARLEGLAEGGGIYISGTAFDHVKNKLSVGYQYVGKQTFKNIPDPVRTYKVLMEPEAVGKVIGEEEPKPTKWGWKTVAAGVLALVVLAGGLVWNFYLRAPRIEPASVDKMAYPLPDKPSIAVLPFVNLSEDPKQEYFTDGMTDDLITDLSKISGLFVIARNSVFQYKGKPVDVKKINRELGVRYVLEGSVRRADNQVRINAQLIDGTTGGHLWAERYDGKMDNIFALQDKITGKIVAALAVKLTGGEQEQVARKDTDNIAAYDAFLQGWEHYRRRTPDDWAKAASYFNKAIELDPNYSRAHAALGSIYFNDLVYGWNSSLGLGTGEVRKLASKHTQKALNNPTSLSYWLDSQMSLHFHEHEKAISEAERAIALDPNDPSNHVQMAYALIFAGRPKEAVDFIKRAMRLDPHYPAYYLYVLGLSHFAMGQLEEAVTLFERVHRRNPEVRRWAAPLAATYAHLGRDQEARAVLVSGATFLARVWYYWPFKDPAVMDRFTEGLRKAGLK